MAKLKIKKECIGMTTFVSGIGQIKITENHLDMLSRRGLSAFLEGGTKPKKLTAKKEEEKEEDGEPQS